MMIARIASLLWENSILKHRDVVLTKVKVNMTFESKIGMKNSPIHSLRALLLALLVEKNIGEVKQCAAQ